MAEEIRKSEDTLDCGGRCTQNCKKIHFGFIFM